MGHPALDYAENELGVHKVHEDAQRDLAELNELMNQLDAKVDERRSLDEQISDREMDILIEERGKHADMSQAGMDRHLKERYHTDEKLKSLRMKRNLASGFVAGLELDIDHTKWRLRVSTSRMEELGGYLAYLGAVKNAEPPPVQYAEVSTSGSPEAAGGETNNTE